MTGNYWNYRLINFGSYIALHEVYYMDGKPRSHTADPASLYYHLDEPLDGEFAAKAIKEAFDKPVLNFWEFPNISQTPKPD